MTSLRFLLPLAAFATGCGLISSNVADVTLKTQDHMFTVDTASWNINATAANTYLNQSCAAAPMECSQWVANACTTNCSGSCDSSTQKCDLGLNVSVYQMVDLNADNPELAKIATGPLVHVTIDSLTYTVMQNTLNVATPPMTVYVAPMTVTNPNDAMALTVGTIPMVAAMSTTGPTNMMFTDTGHANLTMTMGNYKTPFNVLVGTTLVVKSGDPVPSGKLTAVVSITAHAGP